MRKTYKVDDKRTYLTGLSMGGYGTWSLAAALPDKWAAIAPICAGGDPKMADKIKHIPCWFFNGEKDNVEKGRAMVKALQAAGGQPRYSEYPYVGHNSWDSRPMRPWSWHPLKYSHKLAGARSARNRVAS